MINQHFAVLGALFPLGGSIGYAIAAYRGRVQPNRVSWVLWALSPLIAFAAELVQHANLEVSLLTFSVGFGPLLVLAVSFYSKKAHWKITRFDLFCGSISILALVLWAITGKGNIAILLSIMSDMFAAIPTLVKSYTHPKSESALAFMTSVVGSTITLLAIQNGQWNFSTYAFPIYLIFIASVISALIVLPRPQKVVFKD